MVGKALSRTISVALLALFLSIAFNMGYVLATNCGGLFQETPDVTFSSEFYLQTLYVHDMDGDDANDVLIGGYGFNPNYGGFEIHLQRSLGTYSSMPDIHQHTTLQIPVPPTTGADAGDFDNDGDMDVAGAGYDDPISGLLRGWLYDQETGFTFSYVQPLETSNPQLAEAADFNNDGLMDISIGEPVGGVIRIWLQQPDGGFTITSTYEINPWPEWPSYLIREYTIDDLNNDGLIDVLMSYVERERDENWNVIYKYFTTAVFYQPSDGWPSGEWPLDQTNPDLVLLRYPWDSYIYSNGIGIGDLNNDGQNDVCILTDENYLEGASLLIFLNTGTGISTTPSQTISASGYGLAHHFNDLNQDGIDDVLVGYPVRAYFQTSANVIPATPDFTTTTDARLLVIADMDTDGDNDIVAGSANTVYMWFDHGVVPHEIGASANFDPDTLNLNSKGKWITAYIQLPEGYNPENIDASTILLNETIQPVLDPKYDFVTNSSEYLVDHNNDGIIERMLKFDRATLASLIYQSVGMQSDVTLTITGKLRNGTQFEGTYTLSAFWTGQRSP